METSSALTNASSFLPSPADLLMALPRLLSKASSIGDMIRSGGSVIAEPTLANLTNSTITSTAGQFVQESVAAVASAAGSRDEIGMFQAFKNIASFFSYITSKWAIATFAIAILLNRTHFYASSRVPLSFDRLYLRVAIYIAPLLLFLFRIQSVLQAIRCQTSPGWSEMQYGAPGRQLDTDFGGDGGYMWRAASALLFWETTEDSCRAANMFPADPESTRPTGSLALLWPLFLSIGFGQFVETLSCALQGRHPIQEAGMTIFEHSLAFAEAEAVVTRPLVVDSTRFFKPKSVFTPDGTSFLIPRSRLSKIANVPPEVLLISLISSVSHFTSNILAIAGVRSRCRLITTAIWGLAYMFTFAWSFSRLTSMITEPDHHVGILRFPTVCIVGFIPHLLILLGIAACGLIYLLALFITVLSPPPGRSESMTLKQRFAAAYNNLHANIHLSAITPLTINWNEDFYTAILKVGFTVLTAASEAVFLNEGTKINVHSMTWLEKQRLQDILARRRRFRQSLTNIPTELRGDTLATGVDIVDNVNGDAADPVGASGYANERKARGSNVASDATRPTGRNDPAGLQQRRNRFFLTYQFFKSISRLIGLIHARLTIALLRKLRITYRPRWLRRLAGPPPSKKAHTSELGAERSQQRAAAVATEHWLTLDDRTRIRPDSNFDVESFAKERLRQSGFYASPDTKDSEDRLNDYLYSWWRNGGRWGDMDTSSDYIPPQDDDDTTSVVSFATTTDNEEWSDDDDGQRTPTRDTYQRSREATPPLDDAIDFSRLSQLLDPKTKDDREEARLLARHLQSSNMMTRSQYRQVLERDEAKVLTSSRYKMGDAVKMTAEEEEQLLEDLILSKRTSTAPQGSSAAGSWDTGAEGMGSEGPQCVKTSPAQASYPPFLTEHCYQARSTVPSTRLSNPFMQPAPTNVPKHISPLPSAPNTQVSFQHGQHRDDNLQASLQPHSGELQGAPEPPTGGNGRDATRPDGVIEDDDTVEVVGLKDTSTATPPPRNRIAEYESALVGSPRRPSDGPLFEIIKSKRRLDDKNSPIAKLPNEVLIHAIAHLSPNDLAAVSLVSRRFNDVVTTPHAWQVAFARYFPGPQSLEDAVSRSALENNGSVVRSEKRRFTRLTALASWRSEYILRTRLLRSLARGKPVQISSTPSRAGQLQTAPPTITYDVRTFTIINHLHATFGSGLNKRMPRFVHGADDVGMVTSSDPMTGKVDPWGQTDPNFYGQFSERFPGVAEWGLGSGEVVGRPNVMDVSQPYGMIYGQGCPEGSCYYRSPDELRGRFVAEPTDFTMPEAGIPKLGVDGGAICSVWIAKSNTIPSLSQGLIGMMTGSAAGIVTACSIGTDGLRASRVQRGELTARWVLSPGVPIIAITVDENYSSKRHAQNRIWAVALNALGELFYLTKFPTRSQASKGSIEEYTEYLAWLTGRSAYWNLVEPSRRAARPDPYGDAEVDASYSPRTSWDGMCLTQEQVIAETKEVQHFLRKPPKYFRKFCLGWDMRRRLEVDFAADDGNYAGEAMLVFKCGLDEDVADITRYTRWKTNEKDKSTTTSTRISTPQPSQTASLFGGSGTGTPNLARAPPRARSSSYTSAASSPERTYLVEEWRCSKLTFGGFKGIQLATTTVDISTFATLTLSEDPALGFSTTSTASSPYASPLSVASQPASPSDIPGQRARLVAAGTKTGVVILWNIRSPVSRSSEYTNNIDPVRIIYTESPEISCLALTGLHLVVGGNDGLVQAWDPLASTLSPIRTLNSRHASRARRRLVQAQASVQGVGINMFAAGAICLDPDSTVLRGAVSLGNQLRYWSYSSSAADQYKSSKRRLRRSERGSNNAVERFSGTGRANLKDYIANEAYEMERDKQEQRKLAERMAGRFGTELLSDEEALAYAAMLSQESMEAEEKRRRESESSALSSETVTPEPSVFGHSSPTLFDAEDLDADIAEAIRLSLNDDPASGMYEPFSTPPSAFDIPIKYAKGKNSSPTRFENSSSSKGKVAARSSNQNELSDLEFAMQLSLAEEASRKEAEDAFPPLSPAPGGGNGKGKGRMW
ncbi:uncharacterized protein K460DRAFT_406911 [Cucurbitaria berberidis CBS 394.84]|uniref:F-box domain-containing protein n=1 Tax=Cucurbitaria berberidis CBS 394.84 TaxID=1168544 RepID=A0A9P4GJG9_9PLEO|nr:uncharacterized protein K460DRAFT_406911 [Cucurbitaria berberidis CBS 394.84]KAF1846720.1 hypothetical protein K460DRAFT_406911 [Cucurbitaria berberidis CBS 394.84]